MRRLTLSAPVVSTHGLQLRIHGGIVFWILLGWLLLPFTLTFFALMGAIMLVKLVLWCLHETIVFAIRMWQAHR